MCGQLQQARASTGPKGKDVSLGGLGFPESSAAWQVSHRSLRNLSLCDTVTRPMDRSAQHNQPPHRPSPTPTPVTSVSQIKPLLPRCVHPGSLAFIIGVKMVWWAASTGPGLGRGDSAPNVLKVCIEHLMFTRIIPIATSQLSAT